MPTLDAENPVPPNTEITLAVRLNGDLTRLAGQARLAITLVEDSTVEELFAKVGEENPALLNLLGKAIPVVNGRHASRDQVLQDGQEIAMLIPVAGGSDDTDGFRSKSTNNQTTQ